MRRLVYLSSSTIISDAANAVHAMRMCNALAGQVGHLTLIGRRGRGATEEALKDYGVPAGTFDLERTDEADAGLTGAILALRRRVPVLRVGMVPAVLFGRLAIAKRIRRLKPDLILCRNVEWAVFGVPATVPMIVEVHQLPETASLRWVYRRLIARPGVIGFLFISEALRRLFLERFESLTSERTFVLHDAADLAPARASGARETARRPRIAYVGHLYDGRGIDVILEMAERLPDADVWIVGGTPKDVARWKARVRSENVEFTGHVAHAALEELYADFDVMLAPYQRSVAVAGNKSDTSAYMSPLKIFEYMALGKPIVCSDLPVLKEVLEHRVNALLVPPDDVGAWTGAVQSLLDDPGTAERLATSARADAEREYTWARRAERVLAFASHRMDAPPALVGHGARPRAANSQSKAVERG